MRTALVLTVFVGACSVHSVAENHSDEFDPPVRMAPAKSTAAQFLSVFKALCLDGFPQQAKMQAAAQKLGFRKTDHVKTGVVGEPIDLELHSNSSLKLSAQFGKSSLIWVVSAWAFFPQDAVRFTKGKLTWFKSSPDVSRAFCGTCGSPIAFSNTGYDHVCIAHGALDNQEAYAPQHHWYLENKLSFVDLQADLMEISALPQDPPDEPES